MDFKCLSRLLVLIIYSFLVHPIFQLYSFEKSLSFFANKTTKLVGNFGMLVWCGNYCFPSMPGGVQSLLVVCLGQHRYTCTGFIPSSIRPKKLNIRFLAPAPSEPARALCICANRTTSLSPFRCLYRLWLRETTSPQTELK